MTTLFVTFSFLLVLSACGIDRPDTNLYVVNSPGGYARGYNLKNDYDSNGQLKPGAKPTFVPAKQVQDLNKFICTDPSGFANLKAYIQKMRDAYQNCK